MISSYVRRMLLSSLEMREYSPSSIAPIVTLVTTIRPVDNNIIPTCFKESSINLITDSRVEHPRTYVKNLGLRGSSVKRTFEAILRELFQYYDLTKVTTNKGETYYGCMGLILNSNFEPLLISVFNYNSHTFAISPKVIVSPRVLTGKDVISKGIMREVLPIFTEEGTHVEIYDINDLVIRAGAEIRDIPSAINSSAEVIAQNFINM